MANFLLGNICVIVLTSLTNLIQPSGKPKREEKQRTNKYIAVVAVGGGETVEKPRKWLCEAKNELGQLLFPLFKTAVDPVRNILDFLESNSPHRKPTAFPPTVPQVKFSLSTEKTVGMWKPSLGLGWITASHSLISRIISLISMSSKGLVRSSFSITCRLDMTVVWSRPRMRPMAGRDRSVSLRMM